jgi:hypothetical protein
LLKLALIAMGYVAACVVAVRIAISGPDAPASSGMYAFGDAVVTRRSSGSLRCSSTGYSRRERKGV